MQFSYCFQLQTKLDSSNNSSKLGEQIGKLDEQQGKLGQTTGQTGQTTEETGRTTGQTGRTTTGQTGRTTGQTGRTTGKNRRTTGKTERTTAGITLNRIFKKGTPRTKFTLPCITGTTGGTRPMPPWSQSHIR